MLPTSLLHGAEIDVQVCKALAQSPVCNMPTIKRLTVPMFGGGHHIIAPVGLSMGKQQGQPQQHLTRLRTRGGAPHVKGRLPSRLMRS